LKHNLLLGILLPALVAACTPVAANQPVSTPTVLAMSTLPAPPTEPPSDVFGATYRDEANGFQLDYPSNWSMDPSSVVGTRGSQAQLLSPGTTAESVAPGGSRLSITVYQWDPKNDLAAYVAHWRIAWDASGFKVREGSLAVLADGRPAADFFIETQDGLLAYFLLSTAGDRYLQLAGEGDLALIEAMARTLRPLEVQ